jgi:hypothetical protein
MLRFRDPPRIDQFITKGFKSPDQLVAVMKEAGEAIPAAIVNRRNLGVAKVNLPCARTPDDRHFRFSHSRSELWNAIGASVDARHPQKRRTAKMQHVLE